jgi:hypothetical protein
VLQALRFGTPPRAIALHAAAATPTLHADAAPGTAASHYPLRAGTDGDTIFFRTFLKNIATFCKISTKNS